MDRSPAVLLAAVAAVVEPLLRWLWRRCLSAGCDGLGYHVDLRWCGALAGVGSSSSVGMGGGALGAGVGSTLDGAPHAC